MKKIFVIIFAFVYMATSSGASFHMHYCMGKMADWSWGDSTSKTCNRCGSKKSDGKYGDCCEDKYQFLKNDNDQKATETILHLGQSIAVAIPPSFLNICLINFPSVTVIDPVGQSLFRSSPVPIYILNRTFLI